MKDDRGAQNTDRELFQEKVGDYYSNSMHVTEAGAIGIKVGGSVIVMPLAKWHSLAKAPQPHVGCAELVAAIKDTLDDLNSGEVKTPHDILNWAKAARIIFMEALSAHAHPKDKADDLRALEQAVVEYLGYLLDGGDRFDSAINPGPERDQLQEKWDNLAKAREAGQGGRGNG